MDTTYGVLCLIPPIVAIGLALWTKQTIFSLFIAVWLGSTMMNGFNPLVGFVKIISDYVIPSLSGNASLIVLVTLSGGMIAMLRTTGAAEAFATKVTKVINTAKKGQVVTCLSAFIFSYTEPCLMLGTIMRPVTDMVRISRAKLAYILDSMGCNLAALSPISSYGPFITGLIAAELLALIPFYSWTDRAYFSMIIVFAICTVIVSVFGLVFHIYMNRRQNQAYSLNSDINNIVNLTMKKYIASAMLVMSLLNFVAWITFVLMCIIQDTVGDLSFWMYIILQLLSGCTLTVILILARNRKNEMLKADTQPVFVDDDDYWKTGFYYNPNDPHLFVPDRLCSTNYSLNYARTGAKIFTGSITAVTLGLLIWTTIVLIPYIHVTIDIRTTESTVNVSSCGYTSRINIDDITEITLMDSLPDDHFFKYNGGATESYLVGKFKGNTYGKCSLYIFKDVSPVLMIKTADQTVFLNSKKDGEIVNLYNAIKKE